MSYVITGLLVMIFLKLDSILGVLKEILFNMECEE